MTTSQTSSFQTPNESGRIHMIAAAKIAIHALRRLGPYAAIELLLPGGSLLAIALWLYRRYRAGVRPVTAGLVPSE